MDQNYYELLRSEAAVIAGLGIGLQTVIPAVLDAEQHPKRDRTSGKALLDARTGFKLPAFCGKNPSFWASPSQPRLDKPSQSLAIEEVNQRINNAEKWKKPIGLAVIPDKKIAILDFDLKNYDSKKNYTEDIERLLAEHTHLNETRIESTPSGGAHIWVEVEDWTEWQASTSGLHCNFSTGADESHRGEVITGGRRICVCAPTEREDGPYTLKQLAHRNNIVKVRSLSEIGIYPTVKKKTNGNGAQGASSLKQAHEKLQIQCGTVDQLKDLVTRKEVDVLDGILPYQAQDRSGTLTTFANQLFSWNNLAAEFDYNFDKAVEALIQEAADALGISDKLNRCAASFDQSKCFGKNQEWATARFKKVVMSVGLEGYEAPLVSIDETPEEDLEIKQEIEELVKLSQCDGQSVEQLFPEYLRNRLAVILENLEYDWSVIMTVLMVGLSGALPLKNEINLKVGGFKQPLSLFGLLLMPSGEAKSPLIRELILQPWKKSVPPLMESRYQAEMKKWNAMQTESPDGGDVNSMPKPNRPKTLITEDFTPQGIERHFALHSQYANGSVLLLFDEGKDVLKEMSGQSTSTNQLKIGTWILPRYDGSGGQGAKADEGKERDYEECRLAVLMCCQPDVYREIAGDADQTGIAGRIVVVEQHVVKTHYPECINEDQNVRHKILDDLLIRLYRFFCERNEVYIKLGDEAFGLFQKERQRLDDLKNETISDAARSIFNKCGGRIGRLAGLFHILWAFDPSNPCKREVPEDVGKESMERAIALNKILLSGSILARETSDGNDDRKRQLHDLQSMALRVNSRISLGKLKKRFNSNKRLSMKEYVALAKCLHQMGYGELTQDKDNYYYQALKPFKG